MEKENYTNIYTSILDYWNNISNLEFVVTLFLIFLISFIFWYKITKCARISFYYKETTRNNAIIKQSKLFTECFKPTFYLCNGHLQTLTYGILRKKKRNKLRIKWDRELIGQSDGGESALDWPIFDEVEQKFSDSTPILVLLAGLTGGKNDIYIADAIHEAVRYGYKSVLINHRGCSNSQLKTPRMYCLSSTDDLLSALFHIRGKYPNSKIYAIGYSLGSNILTNYLGESGEKCLLSGAVSVGCPYNVRKNAPFFFKSLFGFYNKESGKALSIRIRQHKEALRPLEKYLSMTLEEGFRRAKTATDFDEIFTSKVMPTPLQPYGSALNYYAATACDKLLKDIRIPTLFLSFLDDPLVDKKLLPISECKNQPDIILGIHPCGGHLGGYEGLAPKSWIGRAVVSFIHNLHEYSLIQADSSQNTKYKLLQIKKC